VTNVPLDRIESVAVGRSGSSEAVRMEVALRFKEKTAVGKRLTFWVEPQAAPVLVRWIAQVRPELTRATRSVLRCANTATYLCPQD
jgi:hypothetical protein